MNIFVLDTDPIKAAKYHCDSHVVKMPTETAQILCSVLWYHKIPALFKNTHENHPCNVWARASNQNFEWLVLLGIALCDEYTKRYGKKHASEKVILQCWLDRPFLSDIGQTPFAQVVPTYLKSKDPVSAYRTLYLFEKRHILKWKTKIPEWMPIQKQPRIHIR